MADTLERFAGPEALTASPDTYYTAPTGAGVRVSIRSIIVANETATDDLVTLSIGTDGAGKRIWKAVPVPANGVLEYSGLIVLYGDEIIEAFAGTAAVLTLTISGVLTGP